MNGIKVEVPTVDSSVVDTGIQPPCTAKGTATTADERPTELCGNGRRGVRRPLAEDFEYEVAPSKKKSKDQRTEEDVEVEFDTEWICCECKEAECQLKPEATDMLICDGPCRRLVHYPCAGLSKVPSDDEKFFCNDCVKKRHMCMICAQYGDDDKDVFLCSHKKCGLFFHESCLDMQNVKIDLVADKKEEGNSPRRMFVCPAHTCWTCAQNDLQGSEMKEAEGKILPETNQTVKPSKKQRKRSKAQQAISKGFEAKSDSRLLVCSGE